MNAQPWVALLDSSGVQGRLVLSLLTVLALFLLRRGILGVVGGRLNDPKARYQWGKLSGYVATIIGIILVGQIWVEGLRALGTFLGLVAVGIAFGLRDMIADLAGWFFIIWRQTFEVGDRVQVGEHRGDVVDVGILHFTLLEIGHWVDADQSTGRIIHVPNGAVLSQPIANYTASFEYVWHEIPVRITFESNWRRAKAILTEVVNEQMGPIADEAALALKRLGSRHLISYKTATPTVYTTVQDGAVLLTLRLLCRTRTRRGVSQALWEDILERFAREDTISIAYRTRREADRKRKGRGSVSRRPGGPRLNRPSAGDREPPAS